MRERESARHCTPRARATVLLPLSSVYCVILRVPRATDKLTSAKRTTVAYDDDDDDVTAHDRARGTHANGTSSPRSVCRGSSERERPITTAHHEQRNETENDRASARILRRIYGQLHTTSHIPPLVRFPFGSLPHCLTRRERSNCTRTHPPCINVRTRAHVGGGRAREKEGKREEDSARCLGNRNGRRFLTVGLRLG